MRKHEEKLIAIVRNIGPKLLKSRTKWLSKPQRQLLSDVFNKAALENVLADELEKAQRRDEKFLEKGKSAQTGEIRRHADGSQWRKRGPGNWERISEGKDAKKKPSEKPKKEAKESQPKKEEPKEGPAAEGVNNNLDNPEYAKKGSDVTEKDSKKFIEEFHDDFIQMQYLQNSLRKAGASHFASRLKDEKSLTSKMNNRLQEVTLNQVTDIIGARALVKNLQDQKSVVATVNKDQEVAESEDMTGSAGRGSGYRAVHTLIRTPSGKIAELQIKTYHQQIWSGWAHDRIYKGTPEVQKDEQLLDYAVQVSDYLSDVDAGKMKDSADARPPMSSDLTKKYGEDMNFPWNQLDEFGAKGLAIMPERQGIQFFVVIREPGTRKSLEVKKFDTFQKAKDFKDQKRHKEGWKGELPMAYSTSQEEFLQAFSEYAPSPVYGFPHYEKDEKKSTVTSADPELIQKLDEIIDKFFVD